MPDRTPEPARIRTVYLSMQADERLRALSRERGVSVSALIRQAVERLLEEKNDEKGGKGGEPN